MGALPNLFDSVIAAELAKPQATTQSIALALASSELFLRAVQLGIDSGRQYADNETTARFVRSRIGKAFSAPVASLMF